MYKTKLQELCHQRRWGLPKYSAVKDGPDHIPSFKASVYVNGVIFTSSSASSSLKEAKNQAAMVAFLSFSSGSSTQTSEEDTKEQIRPLPQGSSIPAQSSVIIDDMDGIHKNQLQNNARMNNLNPSGFACKTEDLPPANDFMAPVLVNGNIESPSFSNTRKDKMNNLNPTGVACKTEDLPPANDFMATVLVNGNIESPSFSNTRKDKKQASELMSLSPDIFEKGHSDSFKTSLMKLTEREGFHKPTYKTMQAGSLHMPTFFSTLEIEKVEFHGKGCRSKKEAEEDVAKIAYIALKECKLIVPLSDVYPNNDI